MLERRLILTLNGDGDYIPENVWWSHQDAAVRWGADYVDSPLSCRDSRHFQHKHRLCLDKTEVCYDRCMWIDGDAIIRRDCPNLFELVPPDRFGGVLNAQIRTQEQAEIQRRYWSVIARDLGDLGFDAVPEYHKRYINGGMFVWTPRLHRSVFLRTIQFMADLYPEAMVEQTCLNMALAEVPMHLLSRQFNYMGPKVWDEPRCHGWITHWACYGEDTHEVDKQELLSGIDWAVEEAVA